MIAKAAFAMVILLATFASEVGGKNPKSNHKTDPTTTVADDAAASSALLKPPGGLWNTYAIYEEWNITCDGHVKISYTEGIFKADFRIVGAKEHAPARCAKNEWTQRFINETRNQKGEVHKRGRDGYFTFVQEGIEVALPGVTDEIDFDGHDNSKVKSIFQCNTETVWRPANELTAQYHSCNTTTWSETELPPERR